MVMTERRPELKYNSEAFRKPKLITDIPTLHEDQICPMIEDDPSATGAYADEALIYGLAGARGSGKSTTAAFLGIEALTWDLPVWSNFPIKFELLRHGKPPITKESYPFSFKELFALDPKFRGGRIIIDEYQDWANSYSFMTTQNKILDGFWAQIRKNDLSFCYVSKKLRWIDLKTREETDIEITCRDAYKTREGRYQYPKGQMIYWNIKDLSGNWTGDAYEEDPIKSRQFSKLLI